MNVSRSLITLLVATSAAALYGADVAANWQDQCAKCHGEAGKGDTKMGGKLKIGDLTDPAVQAKFSDEEAFKAIKSGVVDDKGKSRMKAIEGLSDEEIKALVHHVRSLKK